MNAARDLLMREVDHRARNALTVVMSVLRLTRAADVETFKSVVAGRVDAIARAQGVLATRKWEGAPLHDLVHDELACLAPTERFSAIGPTIVLAPDHAQPFAMIIHELTTNALKHGALSGDEGRIDVTWTLEPRPRLRWCETSPSEARRPVSEGFGTRLIRQLTRQMGASIDQQWGPDGLVATIWLSDANVSGAEAGL